MKRICLALILTVAISGVSFAAVNNIKVSGDITTQAITRNLSLGVEGGSTKDSEDFLITQVRLRIDADLTENIAAVVRLINERLWGIENSANTDIDLDLAYLTIKDFLEYPITIILGRQNLKYGRGLIVGDPDLDNEVSGGSPLDTVADDLSLRKAFDAVRVILDYSPVVVDLIYAKTQENDTDVEDDQNLYGVNIAYTLDEPSSSSVDVYLFVKDKDQTSNVGYDNDRVYTVGARAETKVVNENLNLFGEYAYQFGSEATDSLAGHTRLSRKAWAAQAGAEYNFGDEMNTQVGVSYTYLSGDDDSGDADQEAWDPMFEDQRVGEIANLLFDNTNLQYVKASVSTQPVSDVTTSLDVYYLKLAKKLSSTGFVPASTLLEDGNGLSSLTVKTGEKEIGWEVDASLKYDYTEDVQLGIIGGWFFPGDLFDKANDNTAYSVRGVARVEF